MIEGGKEKQILDIILSKICRIGITQIQSQSSNRFNLNAKWQAKEGAGFDMSHFRVNWKRKAVYCPQGKRSRFWKNSHDSYGKPVIRVEFRKSHCLEGIRGFNLRQCRYIGLAKTRLQHILTAAAINLERIYAWLEEIPLAKTRISHFQKLANRKLAIA